MDQQAAAMVPDISPSQAMRYRIVFDYPGRTYTVKGRSLWPECISENMFIRGNFNGYSSEAMQCESGTWTYTLNSSEPFEFKFDVFGDWRENYGDRSPEGALFDQADSFGPNIKVSEGGSYHIRFDYAASDSYYSVIKQQQTSTCGAEGIKLVKTLIGEPMLDMTCEGGSWWARDVNLFKKGNGIDGPDLTMGFWFYEVVNGEALSELRWGDFTPADGTVDRQAPAIAAIETPTANNSFDIRLNLETEQYSMAVNDNAKPCTPNSIYLRGSFNSWGKLAFACNESIGAYQLTTTLTAGTEFKFDVKGDWSENYGDNSGDAIADRNGRNFKVNEAGSYNIRFNYNTDKSFVITKQ